MAFGSSSEALKIALYTYRKSLSKSQRKRRQKPVTYLYPWATEKKYSAVIRAWMKPMIDYVHKYIEEHHEALLHGDSASVIRSDVLPGGSFRRMFAALNGWISTYLPPLDELGNRKSPPTVYLGLGQMAESVDQFNGKQFNKATKANLGIDFPIYEGWWPNTKATWADNNYTLIRSLVSDYIKQVNIKAEQSITNGYSPRQLAAELMKVDKNMKAGRANTIARDQIGKLNGQITQARMASVGLSMYIWSSSGDERVRGYPAGSYPHAEPSHYLMDGLLCRWDDATVYSPDKGKTWIPRPSGAVMMHPGQDIQCRCTALSYWDELVGEVDQEIWEQKNPEEKYQEPDAAYSQERKDEALRAKTPEEYDDAVRETTGKVWQEATNTQRKATYEYTGSSYIDYNEPLRGFDRDGIFKGVGKVDLNDRAKGSQIKKLTDLINNSTYDKDVWLHRGIRESNSVAHFLKISKDDLLNWNQEQLETLLGQDISDHGFISCGSSEGTGFGGYRFNIYCPKGTKMLYSEPFSAHGKGSGLKWDGIAKQKEFSDEDETIIQRGTTFKIIKVEKNGGFVNFDLEVRKQIE